VKKILLLLLLAVFLSACASALDAPRYQDPCAQGLYFSTTALGCKPYPIEQ
jgi:hypothetical protein